MNRDVLPAGGLDGESADWALDAEDRPLAQQSSGQCSPALDADMRDTLACWMVGLAYDATPCCVCAGGGLLVAG